MIKTIIFDNNGVLTDSDKEATISNFAKYFGIEESELVKVFDTFAKPLDDGSISTSQFYQLIADKFDKKYNYAELRNVHINSYQPKLGMRGLLERLKTTHEIALLTNFGDVFDEADKKVWKCTEIFDSKNIFVSSKLKLKKPELKIYEVALKSLARVATEVVFIDDRESNLVPARVLGMNTILFTSPKQCENELQLLLEESNV